MRLYSLDRLSLTYKTKSISQQDFKLSIPHLSINSKGILTIVGKSGSGKSTLLNILYGIEKPTEGSIKFLGKSLNKMSDKKFAQFHSHYASMVFQHYNLFSNLTALDNVALPLLIRGVKRKDALYKAKNLFKKFNLENIINQKADTLSGGEKQRVAILRSIITSPKVILCDEPTGALDTVNSKIVMDMFKEISRDITIIMVSHNLELVNAYADRIIKMVDGKIASDVTVNETRKVYEVPRKLKPSKDKWSNLFVKDRLKSNFKRNLVSFISSSFGFLAIFLAFGFMNGSTKSHEAAINSNYGVGYAKASMKSFYDIENSPLKYEKSIRPTLEDIDEKIDMPSLMCDLNLDYAFSPYPTMRYKEDTILNFEMSPIYDTNQRLEEVVINEEMLTLLNQKEEEVVGSEFIITNEATFSIASDDYNSPFIKDNISYSLNLKVVKVVKEFAFLNSPKVYYSYTGVRDFLKTQVLNNISKAEKKVTSIYDYIDQCDDDNIASSYSYNLFVTDKERINDFFNIIQTLKDKDDSFQISSTPYEIRQNYINFMSSFSNALFVFVIIAFVGVNFIIGMLSLSSFIEHKKEAAILTCLGARNNSIMSIYLKENNILILLSYLFAVGLSIPMQLLINKLVIKYFGLESIIQIPYLRYLNIPFLLPLGLFLIAAMISSLFVMIPLLFYRHLSLSMELKDE